MTQMTRLAPAFWICATITPGEELPERVGGGQVSTTLQLPSVKSQGEMGMTNKIPEPIYSEYVFVPR
jgi:hypothetical protein